MRGNWEIKMKIYKDSIPALREGDGLGIHEVSEMLQKLKYKHYEVRKSFNSYSRSMKKKKHVLYHMEKKCDVTCKTHRYNFLILIYNSMFTRKVY